MFQRSRISALTTINSLGASRWGRRRTTRTCVTCVITDSLHLCWTGVGHHSWPAAFFAFRTYSSADHTAIFAYRERDKSGMKVGGSDLPAIRVCGPYVAAPKRHFVQQSQYTICTMWSGQGPYFYDHSLVCGPFDPSKEFQQDMIYKFELPSSERMTALRELGDYGLNAYALFGSEDGLMESLSTREEASA
ncbi:hypothetical protein ACVW0J_005125 [Bradyrhizobium sp. i1.7.7]